MRDEAAFGVDFMIGETRSVVLSIWEGIRTPSKLSILTP